MKQNAAQQSKSYALIGWVGAIAGPLGAILLALNIQISPFGYPLFLLSSVCMTIHGVRKCDTQLIAQSVLFNIINLIGLVRWLPTEMFV